MTSAPRRVAPSRLRDFELAFAELVDRAPDEDRLLDEGGRLLRHLVAQDDWLPEEWRRADPERYQQYLLHCDSRERFSIVSFVWGPGQKTPIHDHRVWGLVGVLVGAEVDESFTWAGEGGLEARAVARLEQGAVAPLSPSVGDIHRVANAYDDQVSISIHVYGGNIGNVARATYDLAGKATPFVSGYSTPVIATSSGGAGRT